MEQQTILWDREYKTDRQLLSPHAPEEPGADDDAPTMLTLDTPWAAVGGRGGPGGILVAWPSDAVAELTGTSEGRCD